MKIEQEKEIPFKPITIKLETREEVEALSSFAFKAIQYGGMPDHEKPYANFLLDKLRNYK